MVLNVTKSTLRIISKTYFPRKFHIIPKANLNSSTNPMSHIEVPYQSNSPNQSLKFIQSRINELVVWYEQFTGMDEVRMAQNRVLEAEEKFIKAQEKRRDAVVSLSEIHNKLKELYAELDTTTRGEDRYVHLITQEHKLLKEEKLLQEKFSIVEREERDYFAALSSSVKESHEKERAQAERTKYWSIIGSVIGTVLGILGTSINNHFRMKELKKLIKESSNVELTEKIRTVITNIENTIPKNGSYSEYNRNLQESLNQLNLKINYIQNDVKDIGKNSGKYQMVSSKDDAELFILPFQTLSETMHQEHEYTRSVLLGAVSVTLIMAFFSFFR